MDFDEAIEKMSAEYDFAKKNFVPIIRDKSARFLFDFVKDNGFENVLEIGTAIGYSGSIILSAGAEKLTTIDINSESLDIAKNTFSKLGFEDRVTIINDDAKLVIKEMSKNGEHFDMIFLDGAKGQYINYLDDLKCLIGTTGVIFADNVLLHGMVETSGIIPHKKRTMVVNLRKYLDKIAKYPFESKIIRLEDGIALTRYKGE